METDLAGTRKFEYIFFNGQRIARRDGTNPPYYYFSDHLKSTNVVTNNGGAIQDESDYFPYGGEIPITNGDPNTYKFTGKERDAETGLDNFGARYDASSLGRFMTTDWAAKPTTVPYARFGDPQTLNLYAYVENAPVNQADADGHQPPTCSKSGSLACDVPAAWTESSACSLAGGAACANGSPNQASNAAQNQNSGGFWEHAGNYFTGGGWVTNAQRKQNEAQELADFLAGHPKVMRDEVAPIGSLGARAGELAGALGKSKDFITIAVTETQEGVKIVSSSENALRPAVRAMLKEGEVAAKGAGHAEVTGVNAARGMGLTPTGVAASRGICPSCVQFLKDVGVAALSALKDAGTGVP